MSYSINDRLAWYALHVRTNRERAVAINLIDKGYETYLPLMEERRKYSGRIREYQVPCFPGYLFCRLDLDNRLPLLKTPDVYRFLGTTGEAEIVPEKEILSIRKVVESGLSVERCPFPCIGDVVQISSGPLSGLEGILVKLKGGYRAVVSVKLLRRSVSVEIGKEDIESLPGVTMCNTPDLFFSQHGGS